MERPIRPVSSCFKASDYYMNYYMKRPRDRVWSQPHLATRSSAVWTFTDVCLHLQRLQPMYLSQRVDNLGVEPVIRTPADVLHGLDRSH